MNAAAAKEAPPVWVITLTVMLAAFMAVIDTSIVNVALPTMSGNLGASTSEMTTISTVYILANVIVMPLNGFLTAQFGRKFYFAVSLILFTVSSALCGLAWNLPSLVFFRLLQGLGGGALMPTAQSILFETYPREKLGQAMAIFGLGAIVGPTLGPVLGGWLVDNFGWRTIFLINVPVGIVTVMMTLAFIHNSSYHQKTEGRFDFAGLTLLIAGVCSLQYVLEKGQDEDWFASNLILGLTVVAVVGLTAFVWREMTAKNPIVNLRIYRDRTFAVGSLLGLATGFGLYGLNMVLPLFLSSILHYNAWQSGLAILPGALATGVCMPFAGRLADKIDSRFAIFPGMLMFAFSGWWLGTLTPDTGFWNFFYPRILQGFSLGLIFVPLSSTSMSQISRANMSSASGLYSLVRQLGGSFGIAVLTTLLTYFTRVKYAYLSEYVSQGNPTAESRFQLMQSFFASKGAGVDQAARQAVYLMQGSARSQALILAYNHLFRLTAVIFVICSLLVFFLQTRKAAPGGEPQPMMADH